MPPRILPNKDYVNSYQRRALPVSHAEVEPSAVSDPSTLMAPVRELLARVDKLEAALCRITYIHQERAFCGGLSTIARCQDIARRAIDHIPYAKAVEKATEHQQQEMLAEAGGSGGGHLG